MTNAVSEFSNKAIPAGDLPDFRSVDLNPVARAYYSYSLTTTAGFWLILMAIAAFGPRLPFINFDYGHWVVLGLTVATVWFTVIAWLDALRRGWVVREHDLIYRSGVIWRKTVIVPFARIQHVETASGPIERLFGLLRVKCFTAGGMMADLSVEGLDARSAREVRQYLLEQIREDGVTIDPPVEDGPDHEPD